MRTHIGTSGWVYPHWRGVFYPEGLPEAEWLDFYARHFHTVELNNSFYRLPSRAQFANWAAGSPAGFLFAVKASRYITHMKKLKSAAGSLQRLLGAMQGLADKAGPLLFQLPPRWHCDTDRLEAFLRALPPGLRVAFEFRDPSWHVPRVYALLAAHNAAFCVFDLAGRRSPRVRTADFLYLRLHGPGAAYRGRYGRRALRQWAHWLLESGAGEAFVYFDNDQAAHAPRDALSLSGLLAGEQTRA